MKNLLNQKCQANLTPTARLAPAETAAYLQQLHDWQVATDGQSITRRFKFKNFKQTMFFINALAFVCEKEGHHPDASFSFGFCEVNFTTHDSDGLSINDFICAAKLDQLIAE